MRLLAGLVKALCWLLATLALAVAVPAGWAQADIVDEDGYARLAERAARDPALQAAMASELTTRAAALINEHRFQVDSATVHDVAAAFTAGPSFPPLFAETNRAAHAWLFTAPSSGGERWTVDVAPMLRETSIRQLLNSYHVQVPDTLRVPVTVSGPVHQGELHRAAVWGPWVSLGAALGCVVFALITLAAARGRGRALTSLGVSALLVGAAGWAGIEIGRGYLNEQLNRTTGDIRRMADVLVGHAEDSLHRWLNVTLAAGAALVVVGFLVAMIGGVLGKSRRTG
ncbi:MULTISPECIES: hypothetical protein [Mycobacterium]|uniref:Uncharacterized protein n=1 Tax=Mycobacterium kiyosense TaxID=2871094 RepID=A0A9P3Q5V7_9MYCO|nr:MULTISPECIES: hypothetical protein [Mycobacterium]BDB40322.1 hypothetical protein IWGMT90018_07680 [Mycobacterium kiyosense]BDE12143.1 hypothetical protein MKCMC460_10030 [Mycobacterium sp. 20KCMC460]GLB83832.1 hypothetical protein SRL2020028_30880 [Mycobacterium kiyosense]GLB88702.1 hypothetical protein SRL2020130_15190 [Mycobacterium kiyosense]GLB95028.1 hypothetical protein SRL2020226_18040 [Mycobacterium kiyosense]